ncbi:MAG: response regulator [Deltaproteobacteria bacterium]|nr:response regulator [Deltaproteobacteria bacterium]
MKYEILIADDDRDFVTVLKERLESSGFITDCAYEGVRTIELAHKKKPDLILLDWKMPAGGASTVLQYLKEKPETKNIPVIVITGVADNFLESKAASLGAKYFIRKPYDPHLLIDTINEILASRA